MKIHIKDGAKKFTIAFPNALIFSSLATHIIRRSTHKEEASPWVNVSPENMREIRRCIRKMRRIHKNLYLVEADDGGSSVRIKL